MANQQQNRERLAKAKFGAMGKSLLAGNVPPIDMPQARPMTDRMGIIDVPSFDPALGNYAAGRAPRVVETPRRAPGPLQRLGLAFESVGQNAEEGARDLASAPIFAPNAQERPRAPSIPTSMMPLDPRAQAFFLNAITPRVDEALDRAPQAMAEAASKVPPLALDVARATPQFVTETAPQIGEMLFEASGIPGVAREFQNDPRSSRPLEEEAEAAWVLGDEERAADLYRQAILRRAGPVSSILLGAGAVKGAGMALQGARAKRAGEGLLAEAAAAAAPKAPPMDLPTRVGLGLATGAGVLSVADAANARQQDPALAIEDRYVREALEAGGFRVPERPDADRSFWSGVIQGALLDNYDEMQRDPAKVAERDRLRAEWEATPEDQRTAQQAAQMMNAERDADPIGFDARTREGSFNQGRTWGEMATGAGTALLSGYLGYRFNNPARSNALFGLGKGAAYGYGSGEGDVPQEERFEDAARSALISLGVSSAVVPAVKAGAKFVNEYPITATERGWFRPFIKEGDKRFVAPNRLRLRDDVEPQEVVGMAMEADDLRAPDAKRPPILPRLEALIDASPEGVAAKYSAAKSGLQSVSKDMMAKPRFRRPITGAAENASAILALPGDDAMIAWRALDPKQQKMAAAALRNRLASGQFDWEEQSFLASKDGHARLVQLGLIDPKTVPFRGWAKLVGDYASVGEAKVNEPIYRVTGDYVPPRLEPTTAAALGAAIQRPRYWIDTRSPNDPMAPDRLQLKDFFTVEKTPGRRDPREPVSGVEKGADTVLKAAALSAAIPVTGAIDKAIFGGNQSIPPMPISADEELRRNLAVLGVNQDLASSQSELDRSQETFDERRDAEIEAVQSELDAIVKQVRRLEMTPAERPSPQEDGSIVMIDNRAARRAALARAEKLRPALDQARSKLNDLKNNRAADKERETQALTQRVQGFGSDLDVLGSTR